MDIKLIVYQTILDIWNLFKKYGFNNLSEEQWECLISDGTFLLEKYKKQNKDIEILYRNLFTVVQRFYEKKSS